MDYHVLNSTKRKKSLFINFLPNTQNRFFVISKHNNQIIRLKTQSQTPSKALTKFPFFKGPYFVGKTLAHIDP
ncbi:hypothetical protein Hanom_Chr01g00093311 [Helianthus anomalus]